MKWFSLIYHLVLVGAAFTAQIVNNTSAGKIVSEENQKVMPPVSNNKTEVSSEENHKITAKKREIPDALVDLPEEFEGIENKNINVNDALLRESTEEKSGPFFETSSLDEDASDYPLYEAEERRKRTADQMLGRFKRHPRVLFNQGIPKILQLQQFIKNEQYPPDLRDDSDDEEDNEDNYEEEREPSDEELEKAIRTILEFGTEKQLPDKKLSKFSITEPHFNEDNFER